MIQLPSPPNVLGGIPLIGGFLNDVLCAGLFLFVLSLGLPSFIERRDRARESEVKANLRTIQVALERYAVDTGGLYPLILYGGHPKDTFASSHARLQSEFQGDVDWLMEANYLVEYPKNPFRKGQRARLTLNARPYFTDCVDIPCLPDGTVFPRVNTWSQQGRLGHADRSQQWIVRKVGGPRGELMWDVSEGQRHPPFPGHVRGSASLATTPCPHRGCRPSRFTDDYQCWWNAGNFYYYPTFTGIGNFGTYVTDDNGLNLNAPIWGTVTGYMLTGYGAQSNPGYDVMGSYGEFHQQRSLHLGLGYGTAGVIDLGPPAVKDGAVLVIDRVPERRGWINSCY